MNDHDLDQWDRLARDIEQTVDAVWDHFKDLPDAATLARPYAGAWSAKEIIGHLIDSAANNHQRFVRLQVIDGLGLPDYSQDNHEWVAIQRYQQTPWADLLLFWRQFNHHLARIVRSVDTGCLGHQWVLNDGQRFRLDELMIDYLRHLQEHLGQIRERLAQDA